jgi:hypothetical protein
VRAWTHFESWEGVPCGFFSPVHPKGKRSCEEAYAEFLSDLRLFDRSISKVFNEWPMMCLHFMSNTSMNKIAFLGQTAMCIHTGVPSCFRGGFKLLTAEQQRQADAVAEVRLNEWTFDNYMEVRLFGAEHKKTRLNKVKGTHNRIREYVRAWKERGYNAIPDDLPCGLEGHAPSYKQIALCLLKNDMHMTGLGFTVQASPWYSAIKREEISRRKA